MVLPLHNDNHEELHQGQELTKVTVKQFPFDLWRLEYDGWIVDLVVILEPRLHLH